MTTYLSAAVTVTDYEKLEKAEDRRQLVEFIRERFTERYISPMRVEPSQKNGFTIMAISCLMIEALESFYRGWPHSNRKSELAFCQFFDRNLRFLSLRGYSAEFYKHVRCGILHQAETTGGWHVRRDGSIFEKDRKKINAKLFHDEVERALWAYCEELTNAEWDDDLWKNFRKKMQAVCGNCK